MAAAVLEVSSEYPSEPALKTLGPQDVFTYCDNYLSWSPWGSNFTCIESQFCYTEFITVQFPASLYPTNMIIVEVHV